MIVVGVTVIRLRCAVEIGTCCDCSRLGNRACCAYYYVEMTVLAAGV